MNGTLRLRILHLNQKKIGVGASSLPFEIQAALQSTFLIGTCQRNLWVFSSEDFPLISKTQLPAPFEMFRGEKAYEFLLRVACGLESEVIGETDVFGQIKEAWKKYELEGHSKLVESLRQTIQRLYEDTKEVRSRYLQNLGGHSYGSLVRKLLPKEAGSVLLIGAGQISHSVAPWLVENGLKVWNRSLGNLEDLGTEVEIKTGKKPALFAGESEEFPLWGTTEHVVLGIPFDPLKDQARVQAWKRSGAKGIVIHLGGMREHAGPWKQLGAEHFFALDDLFRLMKEAGGGRSLQVEQAEKACAERSKLRALGGSLSIPHGWEDLALFA